MHYCESMDGQGLAEGSLEWLLRVHICLTPSCSRLGFCLSEVLLTGFNHFQIMIWIVWLPTVIFSCGLLDQKKKYFCFKQSPWDDSKLIREKVALNWLDATGKVDILNIPLWGGVTIPAGLCQL